MTPNDRQAAEDLVASVSRANWSLLLRVYRTRGVAPADLEDCLAQATLELVIQARRGKIPADPRIVAGALEHGASILPESKASIRMLRSMRPTPLTPHTHPLSSHMPWAIPSMPSARATAQPATPPAAKAEACSARIGTIKRARTFPAQSTYRAGSTRPIPMIKATAPATIASRVIGTKLASGCQDIWR